MKFTLLFLLFSLSSYAVNAPELLQQYLRIDTTNPPGNEMRGARFLEKIFKDHHIPVEVIDLGNNRANVIATLKGDGSLKPIILHHHIDVVPADAEFWKFPPFSGALYDGEIYGRGAVDIKGKGIVDLATILRFKENGIKLKRDLIFMAVADEETNGMGARWMTQNKRDLLGEAEFLIDEGGSGMNDHFYVSTGEKSHLWVTLRFGGKTGHASVPHRDNPVEKAIHAASALLKMADAEPYVVTPNIERYLEINSNHRGDLRTQKFLKKLAQDPELNALLRNTITITGLSGSEKINTIPNEAKVRLDCRLLPGTSSSDFLAKIKKIAGPDAIVEADAPSEALTSPLDSPLIRAYAKVVGEEKVIPTMLTSTTDAYLYRSIGMHVYGLETYSLSHALIDNSHGNNERMPVTALNDGIDRLYKLILELERPEYSPKTKLSQVRSPASGPKKAIRSKR